MNVVFIIVGVVLLVLLGEIIIRRLVSPGAPEHAEEPEQRAPGPREGVIDPKLRAVYAVFGIVLAVVVVMEIGASRNVAGLSKDVEALTQENAALADSLARVESYNAFIEDVVARFGELQRLLTDVEPFPGGFNVRKWDAFVRVHSDRVYSKEVFELVSAPSSSAGRFRTLIAARSPVANLADIGLEFRYTSATNEEPVLVPPQSVRTVDSTTVGDSGNGFVVEVSLPKKPVGESISLTCTYEWPWKLDRPAAVLILDPRHYGVVKNLGLHVAAKDELEYKLQPRFDVGHRTFDLLRSPEPSMFLTYGAGPEARRIIGETWTDALGKERDYHLYCLAAPDARAPLAFVFKLAKESRPAEDLASQGLSSGATGGGAVAHTP